MGDDILQMIVCLRDGKKAVEQLKAMHPEEAKNVAQRLAQPVDIRTKLGELALQHRASAQHQHPKPKPEAVGVSSSDPPSSGDDSQQS
jgi:hypothetical protein